ncbi:MAG: hypothetical protein FWC29_03315, partial [Methanomassiliicoccaceae archaeon]|nr:hypothetical protein [Methanomassiliicoccaceae archaeon]
MKELNKDKCSSLEDLYFDSMRKLVAIGKRSSDSPPCTDVPPPEAPPEEKRHVCLLCGYLWNMNPDKAEGPKKCPACSSVLWNNSDLKRRQCKQCSHRWMSRIENPSVCPSCRSKLWNKEKERYTCADCGSTRTHRPENNTPTRCTDCGSANLSPGTVDCVCKRCGYGGKMDPKRVNRCPICMTTLSRVDMSGHEMDSGSDRP